MNPIWFSVGIFLLLAGCVSQPLPSNIAPSLQNEPAPIPLAVESEGQNPPPALTEELVISKQTLRGTLSENQTWKEEILIDGFVFIPENITLTIEPGTKIKFKHNRDYKNPQKSGMELGGKLIAIGSPTQPIWFTSDAEKPQNGDWAMIRLFGKNGSEISYAVIEFGQQGINLWNSDAKITHSIVRWNNWEGLYAESYSTPIIEYNRVYQNGYNGMAMEQFNDATVRNNIFAQNGTHGLHVDASKALVEKNIFKENGASGLSLDNISSVEANENTLENNHLFAVQCGEGENKLTGKENKLMVVGEKTNCPETTLSGFEGTGITSIEFDYGDAKPYDLGYTPGDRQKDKYAYVYGNDETRKIVKKIGNGLGLTWSLAWNNKTKTIWTSSVSGEIYHMDPITGNILEQFRAPSSQPWGMAFDGEKIWITDFAEKRTYALNPQTGQETFSFPNPDQEHGAKGLEWNNGHLYIMGWTTNKIYQMDMQGKLVKEIDLDYGAGGGLAFDGQHFWVPCDGICEFSEEGKLIGKIYPASEGTWDLTWEPANNAFGGYLWASQRANENWYDDAKIFKLEILDDQMALNTQAP